MSSSIFSSDYFRRYAGLPRRLHAYHLALILVASVLLMASSCLLRFLYYGHEFKSIHAKARDGLSPDTRVVSMGASLVRSGIKPSLLSRPAVNLAPDSADYRALYLVLRANADRMQSIRWVLLELDNLCLLYDRINSTRDYGQLYDLGARLEDFNGSGIERITRYLTDNPVMYPIFYMPRLTPDSLIEEESEAGLHDEAGFMASSQVMTPEILAQRNLQEDEGLLQSPVRSDNQKALFQMIDLLTNRHIRIVFLRMPQNREYAGARSAQWQKSESELVDRVQQRLGDDWVMLDMRFVDDIDTSCFSDSRHLNYKGAVIFTHLLDRRLQENLNGYRAR